MNTDPWSKLDTLLATTIEPTGPEWFTLKEFTARYNLGRQQARYRIEKLQREKQLETWTGGKVHKYRAV